MINLLFSSDNNFIRHCAAAMTSILCNSDSDINFFIIGDITDENKSKMASLKNIKRKGGNFSINYLTPEDKIFDDLPLNEGITKATYYRLLVTKLLPENIDKIIYLDCDVIVRGDIKELYDIDIENYYAAVTEAYNAKNYISKLPMQQGAKYFNAGIILFNLKALRKFDFFVECMKQYENIKNVIRFLDQDILNMVFYSHVLYIPPRWNFVSGYMRNENPNSSLSKEYIMEEKKNIKIIHYNGGKPWETFNLHTLREEYFVYAALTAWKDELHSEYARKIGNFIYMLYRFFVYFLNHPLFFVRAKFWRKV
ncbi:MAG: glycosyltransferase family 8 protein, partial [Endomicrobium sp.]|nr:glycosyltransferase family 8 protein [Endomicrobium sp.]